MIWLLDETILSLLLAVVSVLVGAYSVVSTIKFTRDYKENSANQIGRLETLHVRTNNTVQSLERVEGSITTRSVGVFPDHIPEITKVLARAKKEIFIASEGGYGASTAPELYIPYSKTILEKGATGVKISIILPSAEMMGHHRRSQFNDWEKLGEQKEFRNVLNEIGRRSGREEPIATREDFFSCLAVEEDLAREELSRYAKVYSVQSLLPVNFWIADRVEAVFAIKSFGGEVFSYAFETRDGKLIDALIASFSYYRESPGSAGL